jgi:hypothetical protein
VKDAPVEARHRCFIIHYVMPTINTVTRAEDDHEVGNYPSRRDVPLPHSARSSHYDLFDSGMARSCCTGIFYAGKCDEMERGVPFGNNEPRFYETGGPQRGIEYRYRYQTTIRTTIVVAPQAHQGVLGLFEIPQGALLWTYGWLASGQR